MAAQVLSPHTSDEVLSRFGLLATAAFVMSTAFRIYPAVTALTPIAVAVPLLYALAFTLTGIALLATRPVGKRTLWLIAGAALFALTCSAAYGILHEIPSYGTDVIAFAHAGGEQLLEGTNPYSLTQSDIQSNLDQMSLREGLVTETLSGGPVQNVTYYPGLHVLIYTVGLAVGVTDLRWVTLLFQIAALAVLWMNVDVRVRYMLPAVLLLEPYLVTQFTAGGVSDWLWVLPLLLGATALHRTQYAYAGIWIGLACAVKQQPWFALPFLAIWVAKTSGPHESERSIPQPRTLILFVSMVGLGFLVPNFPFIIWSFPDWIRGVLGPATLDLVPSGQGLVLLLNQGYLSITRTEFTVLALLVAALLSVLYYTRFAALKAALWLLPPIILFFSYRSLHSYFVYWLPLIALWLSLRINPSLREGEPQYE